MSDKPTPIPPPAGSVTIYHPQHGQAHCMPGQVDDMKLSGWSTDKPKDEGKKSDGK